MTVRIEGEEWDYRVICNDCGIQLDTVINRRTALLHAPMYSNHTCPQPIAVPASESLYDDQ